MKKELNELIFGDALKDIDTGGLNLNNLINFDILNGDVNNDNNNDSNNENNNDNNSNDNNNELNLLENDSDNGEKHDENDLGVDVICSDENGKIFKLTDLIIPLDDNKKESTENYLRKLIERVKKDKNEKNEKEDIKKREKNEKEEISKLMKRSKKNQKYLKVNIGYDEKFFDKTLFLKKNNEFKDNENRNNNLDDEKNKQEAKKDNSNKTKINYNYDDLIRNTLLQYLQYYNNNKFDKIEKEKNENEDEKKEMKIEDDITKDFKIKYIES